MGNAVDIRIAAGAEEIGLAMMLKDLLAQNMEQRPEKIPDFQKLSIDVGLFISDAEVEITLSFSGGRLIIYPGLKKGAGLVITAGSDTIMALSNLKIKGGMPYYFDKTGREVALAMVTGRLKVKGMLFHFPSLIRISRVMSVQ